MHKRVYGIIVLALLTAMIAGCGGDDDKKTDEKVYKVGILSPIGLFDAAVESFKASMTERGYVEGENITYVYEGAVNSMDIPTLAEHVKPLIDAKVDVIMVGTTPGALACQQATSEVPVVFTIVTDPIGAGLVAEWRAPGGNLTGLSDANVEPKQLENLLRIVPTIKRLYVPYNDESQAAVTSFANLQETAQALNVELVAPIVKSPEDVMQAITDAPEDIDGVFILGDVTMFGPELEVAWGELAEERGIPVTYPTGAGMDVSIMSYGIDLVSVGQQTAAMVDEVLRGADPATLPVRQLEFALTVNLVVAERYGIEVPDEVLRLANNVIRE